ncbi:YebC/PmpR family DNA-binding transcriptional regulator [Candidatus Woesebacteria bacterium]|nr:YebC/PmpR family DNA-binding transcriptional regulator [Candidatus Woesebacteria bacterium]
MSGHSKWATIHRAKEIKDAARGNLFSKIARAIQIAVKSGGGPSPDSNFKLRVAIDKAHAANMPKDNIERAIVRAQEAGDLQEITYEGFAPSGVGVLVEVATDNKNRTAQEIKNIFERAGGSLAGPGAVSYNFESKGFLVIKKDADPQAQMLSLIDQGVEDMEETDDGIEIYVSPDKLSETKKKLDEGGFSVISFEPIMRPINYVSIKDTNTASKVLGFLDTLNEQEDVQKVYANLEVPDQPGPDTNAP